MTDLDRSHAELRARAHRHRKAHPPPQLLEPVEKLSFGADRPNMLIEGDNLQVLASLKPSIRVDKLTSSISTRHTTSARTIFGNSDKRLHDPDADDSDAVYVSNEDGGRRVGAIDRWLQGPATLRTYYGCHSGWHWPQPPDKSVLCICLSCEMLSHP